MNKYVVDQRLAVELNPKKKGLHWRHQRGRSATSASIGSQYSASRLPPDWRRQEREPPPGSRGSRTSSFKFYTYFAPDGKTFLRWPDALAHFIEIEKRKGAEKASEAQVSTEQAPAAADSATNGPTGCGEEEKGAVDKQMADADGGDEEEEGDDDEEIGDEDDYEQQQQQTESNAGVAGSTQMWWCNCCRSISSDGTCHLVQRDRVFGRSLPALRDGGLEAARYKRLVESYILLLKYLCLERDCLARVGSHGPTLQLLIEIVLAELPAPSSRRFGFCCDFLYPLCMTCITNTRIIWQRGHQGVVSRASDCLGTYHQSESRAGQAPAEGDLAFDQGTGQGCRGK